MTFHLLIVLVREVRVSNFVTQRVQLLNFSVREVRVSNFATDVELCPIALDRVIFCEFLLKCPSRVIDDIARRHYDLAALVTLILCRNARLQQDTTEVLLRLRESSTATSQPSLLRFVARNKTDLKKEAPDDKG